MIFVAGMIWIIPGVRFFVAGMTWIIPGVMFFVAGMIGSSRAQAALWQG